MKTRILPLLLLLLVSTVSSAQTTVSLVGVCVDCPATINAFINCSVASAGTLQEGAVIGAGVTQTISVSVTKVGKYNLSTTANGITFSATGTFTATGTQNVVLTASGVPAIAGTTTFTLTSGILSCTFSRTVANPAVVIAGACPTKLRFIATNISARNTHFGVTDHGVRAYALSTDSTLYALPHAIYTVQGDARTESKNYSPVRFINLPKLVELSDILLVGVDGKMYLINGDPSTAGILQYPQPPTGTKWVDCHMDGNNPGYYSGMNDLGEVYVFKRIYTPAMSTTTPQKLPNPAGTPATFKYTSFQKISEYQMLRGNDGNYYSWGGIRLFSPSAGSDGNSLGWGSSEITSPPTTGSGPSDVANGFPSAADIRKMQYPAGVVLKKNSASLTVDGRCFILGTIARSTANSSFGGNNLFMTYPFKDGDYDLTRSDIINVGSQNGYGPVYITTTPREIALPVGATKFLATPLPAYAAVSYDQYTNAETERGGIPMKAFTDNGTYGYMDKKYAHRSQSRGFDFLELSSVTNPLGGTLHIPKYMPFLPEFQNAIPPIDEYALDAITGAFYMKTNPPYSVTTVPNAANSYGSYGLASGFFYIPFQKYPTVEGYTHMLNGNCDATNPYPEP